jgi:hypothetical protein
MSSVHATGMEGEPGIRKASDRLMGRQVMSDADTPEGWLAHSCSALLPAKAGSIATVRYPGLSFVSVRSRCDSNER